MDQTESVTAQIRTWWQRVEIKRILWIWLGMTVVLVIFAVIVPARLMGTAASPTMRAVESTMTIFSVAAAPVMALVLAIAVYSLISWRSRGSEPPTGDGPADPGQRAGHRDVDSGVLPADHVCADLGAG